MTRLDRERAGLKNKILATSIELYLNQGKVKEATELYDKRQEEEGYKSAYCTFRTDKQNGNAIYQGGHCFYGAWRDSVQHLHPTLFWKPNDRSKPSDKHLKDYVKVVPYHVFFYRNGKQIMKPDYVANQQPTEKVPGFSKHDTIYPPFEFSYKMRILVYGPFAEFLRNKKAVEKAIWVSTFRGQGAGRGVGYGNWEITKIILEDWKFIAS